MPVSPSRLLVRACRRHIGWLQRSQRRRNVWLLSLSFGLFLTLLLAYEKFGDHRFAKHVNRAPCNRTREETASEPAKSCAEFTSASTQLRYPTHGGALNVLCSEGYSIEQFRALAEKRLSESREAQNGAAGYAGVLRGESPCCELSAAFSFQAAHTPAHRDQSYFYEIRSTWVRDLHALNAERRGRFTIGYMFFMGARYSAGYAGNTSHESDDELIEREATAYGDILRLDVGDSYLNHTRKVVAVYEWVTRHCGEAHYLLKSDDDVFVNVDRLESDLRELERSAALETARDSLAYTQFGYVESRTAIQRVEDSKQFLSFEVFPWHYFEFDYVYGFAALTPLPLVRDVLALAMCVRGVFLDDTFVTGYLPYLLGARVQNWLSLNTRIIWKKPARVTWTYVSDFSLTPELAADELLAVYVERQLHASAH